MQSFIGLHIRFYLPLIHSHMQGADVIYQEQFGIQFLAQGHLTGGAGTTSSASLRQTTSPNSLHSLPLMVRLSQEVTKFTLQTIVCVKNKVSSNKEFSPLDW